MTTLVTGATGFIGSAIVRKLLDRERSVRVLARITSDLRNLSGLRVEVVRGELGDVTSLRSALRGVTALYHVAADYRLWVPDPSVLYAANVEGTRSLLACAAEAGVGRVVYTSSVATLGLDPAGKPADESTPVTVGDMIGHYKRSKFLAEEVVQNLAARGLPVVIVNPSAPVGPRDLKPTPTGRVIREAAAGRMPAFVDTGLNIAHVDDVAEGHLRAFDRGRVGERYILGGENLSLRAILGTIAELTGRPAPRLRLPRRALYPIAAIAEALARITHKEPMVTVDALRMAGKHMFYTSAKAERELGYRYRPAPDALRDAVRGFGVPLAEVARR